MENRCNLHLIRIGVIVWIGLSFLVPVNRAAAVDIQVNTTTLNDQGNPSVGMSYSGNFVIAWESASTPWQHSVYAQRFDSSGTAVGPEFQVNSYTSDQFEPSAAMDSSGNFVIAWTSNGQDGSGYGVYAKRYDSAGNAVGPEFKVNSFTNNDQMSPSVAMDSVGNFVITWTGRWQDNPDYGDYGIYAQRYDSSGNTVGPEFRVNTNIFMNQNYPSVAMDPNGNFVIAWSSAYQDVWYTYGIYAQRYDSSGNPVGGEFRVNSYITGDQMIPSVALDPNGNFVIAWTDYAGQDGSGAGVYAQRYDSAGSPAGFEFRVNSFTTNDQEDASVAMDSSGNFVITWWSRSQDGSGYGVYAQRYDSAGTAVDAEFRVNSYITGNQLYPSVAMAPSGNFVIAWMSDSLDGSGFGVFMQPYFLDSQGPVTSNVMADPNPVAVNMAVHLTATVDDSTTGGSLIDSAEYRINGGTYTAMEAVDFNFDSVVESVEADLPGFVETGVYEVCIRGWDIIASVSGADECILLPVYDPDGGFVTGGGWIYSPAGAYMAAPASEGKASFGFVSKYIKGASTPSGNTEFQFNAGNLNFHSDTYDWLVVTGSNYAKFKGVGTVNGYEDYKFQIWAGDATGTGGADTFRIRIWTEDEYTGDVTVAYDNGADQAIGGGSIVIHIKK